MTIFVAQRDIVTKIVTSGNCQGFSMERIQRLIPNLIRLWPTCILKVQLSVKGAEIMRYLKCSDVR